MAQSADELFDIANALKEEGDLEGAIEKLQLALETDETHVLAHSALAIHLQKMGRNEDAITHAVRVTELEPEDSFSFTQLSVICQRCGRIAEAEAAMERARSIEGREKMHD